MTALDKARAVIFRRPVNDTADLELELQARQVDALERIAIALEQANGGDTAKRIG